MSLQGCPADDLNIGPDREDMIRLYPALNMDEAVLREGLQIMEDAIRHVEKHGHVEGNTSAYPSGVSGF